MHRKPLVYVVQCRVPNWTPQNKFGPSKVTPPTEDMWLRAKTTSWHHPIRIPRKKILIIYIYIYISTSTNLGSPSKVIFFFFPFLPHILQVFPINFVGNVPLKISSVNNIGSHKPTKKSQSQGEEYSKRIVVS